VAVRINKGYVKKKAVDVKKKAVGVKKKAVSMLKTEFVF